MAPSSPPLASVEVSSSGQRGPPPATEAQPPGPTDHMPPPGHVPWLPLLERTFKISLGGGNSSIFVCSPPLTWGNGIQLDEHMFQMGGSTTN